MQRLIMVMMLAVCTAIYGCSQTDMRFSTNNENLINENEQLMNQNSLHGQNAPGESADQVNPDAFYNEGQGY